MGIPYVIEKSGKEERAYDLYSRLLKDRIIFLSGEISPSTADSIVAQLLFLEAVDPVSTIYMYINSPGGEIGSGLSIYDTMLYIKPEVSTLCYGTAASMASLILAAGVKGKRFALSNATILIHQPLGGFHGQVSDIIIHRDHIVSVQEKIYNIYCKVTGKTYKQIEKDCDRDNFMTPEEAIDYGLIDEVLLSSKVSIGDKK